MKKFIAWCAVHVWGRSRPGRKDGRLRHRLQRKKVSREGSQYCIRQDSQDLGTFSEDGPIVKWPFTFTNGDAPLVIHQAIASCGCTVPTYPDAGKTRRKGKMEGDVQRRQEKYPRAFPKKSITVRTNAKEPMVKL